MDLLATMGRVQLQHYMALGHSDDTL